MAAAARATPAAGMRRPGRGYGGGRPQPERVPRARHRRRRSGQCGCRNLADEALTVNRRHFLKASGLTGSAALLAGEAAAQGSRVGRIDLRRATVVVRPGVLPNAERTAAAMLVDEIANRCGLRLPISTIWPAPAPPIAITPKRHWPAPHPPTPPPP